MPGITQKKHTAFRTQRNFDIKKKLKFNIGKNNLQIQNKNLKTLLMAYVVIDTQSA